MRLHFQLSHNTQTVPYDYQHFLTGAFHKWLGENDLHDGISLYSLGWLSGGVTRKNDRPLGGLDFPNGARWFISAHDSELLHHICVSAQEEAEVCCGMNVTAIQIVPEPDIQRKRFTFKVASPVLARGKEIEGKVRHYIYSDPEADEILTQTLRHKMDTAGLDSTNVSVKFDRTYAKPKVKLVRIKNISNRCSICPVIVEGSPEAIRFAWNVGVGQSSGSGFGALI